MKAILDNIRKRLQPRFKPLAVLALVGVVAALWYWRRGGAGAENGATFVARRGPLEISVLEGGNLQALESQEIKCEVRVGYQGTKILRIVEEGYLVTDEDVRTGKVLVELDSSEIEKQMVQQEIQFQSASAALIDAQQAYDIQLNQNLSDIKAAEQKARFARMEFDKFLGDAVTAIVSSELGLDAQLAAATTNPIVVPSLPALPAAEVAPVAGGSANDLPRLAAAAEGAAALTGGAAPVAAAPATSAGLTAGANGEKSAAESVSAATAKVMAAGDAARPVRVDFLRFAKLELLGDGEAKQKLRKLEDDLLVAQKELGQAQVSLDGTRRLFEKGFVTRVELQRDEISFETSGLKVQAAETARALFLKYDFVKSAEQALSTFSETVRELNRARKAAVSRLAQAEARLRSAQAQYSVQVRQRADYQQQMSKCHLRATQPGLVVYGGNRDDGVYYGDQERIREGATVRERQSIITIPNLNRMAVNVKIHESYIKKVHKGQKATILIDAFPDKSLKGEVTKVGVLPDSQNRWMNPDLKVYLTQITIAGAHDWVKPGMSAKVEIEVDRLDDVVYVPIQAVVPEDGKHYCHVVRGLSQERRAIEVGQFNDNFIEVRQGIQPGELVLLRPPEAGAGSEEPAEPASGKTPAKSAPAGTPTAKPAEPKPVGRA